MDYFLAGTYTGVAIWTSIEPSVGVVCACLPTLRPLLRELLPQRFNSESVAQYLHSRSRKDHTIELKSAGQGMPESKPPGLERWTKDVLDLHPKNNLSRETAVTSSTMETNCYGDEVPFAGIAVQREVRIDRESL